MWKDVDLLLEIRNTKSKQTKKRENLKTLIWLLSKKLYLEYLDTT